MSVGDDRVFSNIERFIQEVSTRSCIWNIHNIDYKKTKKRKAAWEEICKVFFSNYNSRSNDRKEHLCRMLQKKWKSLRDTYVRDLRKNKFQYVHSNSLSFLRDSINFNRPIESKIEADEEDTSTYNRECDPLEEEEEGEPHHQKQEYNENDYHEDDEMLFKNNTILYLHDTNQNSNSNKSIHLECQILAEQKATSSFPEQSLNSSTSSNKNASKTVLNQDNGGGDGDDDEDRLFLLSLVKDLKKIPEYNKLEAKSELLLVLNKWKKSNGQIYCSDTM